MDIQGWYYLHQDGSMIYKHDYPGMAADFRESDFVRAFWPFNAKDREGAWRICVEGLAAGAKPERIKELAKLWQCDDEDAAHYSARSGCEVYMDGNAWCAVDRHHIDLQASPAGFGDTALEAMAALCKQLGYQPRKTWGATFVDLLNGRENAQFGVGA